METHPESKKPDHRKAYGKFGLMMFASFVAMYLLMFINMDRIDHFQFTLNRIYMAVCMIAVMTSQMVDLNDAEANELAREIIEAQKREIAEMKAIIYRLNNKEK